MDATELASLVGWVFPGGSWRLEPWWNSLACDVFRTLPAPGGVGHPMACYFVAFAGMGVSLDELFEVCGSSAQEGPMIGDCEIELRGPIPTGATYNVSGAITKAARKTGRSGIFDVVTFTLDVHDQTGVLVGVSTNSLVFPRASS